MIQLGHTHTHTGIQKGSPIVNHYPHSLGRPLGGGRGDSNAHIHTQSALYADTRTQARKAM